MTHTDEMSLLIKSPPPPLDKLDDFFFPCLSLDFLHFFFLFAKNLLKNEVSFFVVTVFPACRTV